MFCSSSLTPPAVPKRGLVEINNRLLFFTQRFCWSQHDLWFMCDKETKVDLRYDADKKNLTATNVWRTQRCILVLEKCLIVVDFSAHRHQNNLQRLNSPSQISGLAVDKEAMHAFLSLSSLFFILSIPFLISITSFPSAGWSPSHSPLQCLLSLSSVLRFLHLLFSPLQHAQADLSLSLHRGGGELSEFHLTSGNHLRSFFLSLSFCKLSPPLSLYVVM